MSTSASVAGGIAFYCCRVMCDELDMYVCGYKDDTMKRRYAAATVSS